MGPRPCGAPGRIGQHAAQFVLEAMEQRGPVGRLEASEYDLADGEFDAAHLLPPKSGWMPARSFSMVAPVSTWIRESARSFGVVICGGPRLSLAASSF
jgi:hypothetical protein